MNPGEFFKSRAVQIVIATNAIALTVGFFYGSKIIEQIIEYRNFQDAQKILQSADTLCKKTNKSIVSAEDIPKNIMDHLSVAEPTVETPSIKNLHILGSSGVAVFACEPKRPVLPGTELSQISPLHPSTALTQILQNHNSRG
jgi:hypothetical protein